MAQTFSLLFQKHSHFKRVGISFLFLVGETDAVALQTRLWCTLREKQTLAALETLKRPCL